MRIWLVVLCIPFMPFSVAAADVGRPTVPLTKMFPFLEDYLAIDPASRSNFELTYEVQSKDDGAFELWIERDGTRVDLQGNADDHVDPDRLAAFIDDDPVVYTTIPKGRGSVSMTLAPRLDLSADVAVSDVKLALSQANKTIKKKAGLMAFAAPKMKSVQFDLAENTTATLVRPDGQREILPVANDTLIFTPGRKSGDDRIEFSIPPLNDHFVE
ncbi:hypothetical protein [Henriciella litoralis]|uniref:hypothetical protein n=1 Tax=Henriciella litoralis TaxID=568102 RepID=UPI000A00135B|nr:hypothetical protein [Henriciella litoralis]